MDAAGGRVDGLDVGMGGLGGQWAAERPTAGLAWAFLTNVLGSSDRATRRRRPRGVRRPRTPIAGCRVPSRTAVIARTTLVSSQIWTDSSIRVTVRCARETSVDNDALLRQHGLQVTAQRLAVLRAVSDRPHSTADDIDNVVRAEIGAISRQAVYDALGALTDKGLLRRIQPAGSPARYEDRVGDNHHHLICRTCGRMVDVDCAVGDTPCLTAADDAGYEIDEAEVIYWGRCPECVAARPSGSQPTRTTRQPKTGEEKDRRV